MRVVLWIVGEPGAGKTSLARALLGPNPLVTSSVSPKWTLSIPPGVVAAGHYTGGTFDGADTISYSGGAAAIDWWAENVSAPLTILDGDRLSNRNTIARLMREPVILACAYLELRSEIAAERRAARGSDQNASWVKGRSTKARRFFESFPGAIRITLDGELPPDVLAREIHEQIEASREATERLPEVGGLPAVAR